MEPFSGADVVNCLVRGALIPRPRSGRTGYGAKRFIELFRASVGLAPKTFSRVRRFQSVIDRLADGSRVEWAAVAADGGYSDQPHLNREFRRMAGVTPCAYRPVEPGNRNHVAVDAEKFVQDASRDGA